MQRRMPYNLSGTETQHKTQQATYWSFGKASSTEALYVFMLSTVSTFLSGCAVATSQFIIVDELHGKYAPPFNRIMYCEEGRQGRRRKLYEGLRRRPTGLNLKFKSCKNLKFSGAVRTLNSQHPLTQIILPNAVPCHPHSGSPCHRHSHYAQRSRGPHPRGPCQLQPSSTCLQRRPHRRADQVPLQRPGGD